MSTALTGPTAELGVSVRVGVEAAFEEFNQRNAASRIVELIALDDGYEPQRTAPNMRALINDHRVVAVLGNVGAPCAVTAVPIANETKTPLIGYVTGGSALRKTPPDRYVINYRASLAEEAAAIVEGFVASGRVELDEIAFFTQRDNFGDSFFAGGIAALQRLGLTDTTQVVHARYDRNTIAVQHGLTELMLSDRPIKAVAIGGAGLPSGELIREARLAGFDVLFGAVSFVEASNVAQRLGTAGDGVVVVQVVPHVNADLPLVNDFRQAMRTRNDYAQSFMALEGYVIGRMLCYAIERIDGQVDRDTVTDALLELGDFDIGLGIPLRLAPDDHQACHSLWPTVLRDGRVAPFDWSDLARKGSLP